MSYAGCTHFTRSFKSSPINNPCGRSSFAVQSEQTEIRSRLTNSLCRKQIIPFSRFMFYRHFVQWQAKIPLDSLSPNNESSEDGANLLGKLLSWGVYKPNSNGTIFGGKIESSQYLLRAFISWIMCLEISVNSARYISSYVEPHRK